MIHIYFLNGRLSQFLIRVGVVAVIGLALFLGLFLSSDMSLADGCNSCFIPFCVLLFLGLVSLGNYYGAFDLATYGMASTFYSLRKGSYRPYKDLIDYKEKKSMSRKSHGYYFFPYFIGSLLFLIPTIVLFILIKVS